MVRMVLVVSLWAFTSWAGAAQIVATVDRNVVGVNEAIHLTFEADGETGAPDFSPLREHFEILDRSRSQNLSIENGQTSRKLVWELILMATQPGEFRIPPIRFGDDQSQAIDIKVEPQGAVKDEQRTIYLNVEVDTEQPYVQQQIIFTVKLFRAVEVASATLSELEVEGVDAIVERFGDDKDYQIVQNGRRWLVVERKYLVFPQQSGYMTIRPLRFRGNVVPRQTNLGFSIFNQSLSKPVVLQSESVTLQVREPPASFVGSWLPAKQITMEESWPEVESIRVGDPITRSITVSALGLSAAQLPELQADLPAGLRGYPEQAQLDNVGRAGGIQGSRTEATAMIPMQAGVLTLPEIQLKWWNVDKQHPELATVPARSFKVLPAAPATAETQTVAATEPATSNETGPVEQPQPSQQLVEGWWPWVSLVLALAWFITSVLWLVEKRRAATIPRPEERGSTRPRVTARQVQHELKRACTAKDAKGTRDALIRWGEVLWPDDPPGSLGELARRCGAPISEHMMELEQVLYADEGTWEPAELSRAVQGYKPVVARRGQTAAELEPLFRT